MTTSPGCALCVAPTLSGRCADDAVVGEDPGRSPATARYLDGLLRAFNAEPLPGESFTLRLQSDLDDPTTALSDLDVAVRTLAGQVGDDSPAIISLTGTYHNLLRRWADS